MKVKALFYNKYEKNTDIIKLKTLNRQNKWNNDLGKNRFNMVKHMILKDTSPYYRYDDIIKLKSLYIEGGELMYDCLRLHSANYLEMLRNYIIFLNKQDIKTRDEGLDVMMESLKEKVRILRE